MKTAHIQPTRQTCDNGDLLLAKIVSSEGWIEYFGTHGEATARMQDLCNNYGYTSTRRTNDNE